MCVLASDSMSEDFFFHKHNNHCETCVNIHSHILAQPNLADNAERFVPKLQNHNSISIPGFHAAISLSQSL